MPEIFSIVKDYNILIVGNPSAGKTYLSMAFTGTHKVIHTDDYIKYGHEESINRIMNDAYGKTAIEGMSGYRLLRHGLRNNVYFPDIVIEIVNNNVRYPKDKHDKIMSFIKANQTILNDYKSMPNDRPPVWLKIQNKYAGDI